MSVLAYPRTNDEEIFRHCGKDCGVVTATEDFQYFALRCIFCSEKFLYFDSFIGHMQTAHLGDQSVANTTEAAAATGASTSCSTGAGGDGTTSNSASTLLGLRLGEPMSLSEAEMHRDNGEHLLPNFHEIEDLTDADTALLEPQMVIKQELQDLPCSDADEEEDNDDLTDSNADPDEDEAILPESDVPVVSGSSSNLPRTRMKVTKPRQTEMKTDADVLGDGDGGDSFTDDYGDLDNYMDDNSGSSWTTGSHSSPASCAWTPTISATTISWRSPCWG